MLATFACSEPPTEHHLSAVPPQVPTLRHIYTSSDVETSPAWNSAFSLAPDGTIYLLDEGIDDGRVYSVIDTSGRVVDRFGKRGEGPGEFRSGIPQIGDSALILLDPSGGRVSTFDLSGRVRHAARLQRPDATGYTWAPLHGILGLAILPTGSMPVLIDTRTGRMREMLARSDRFLKRFPERQLMADGSTVKLPVLGVWQNGFLIADGFDYRIALYDWDGNSIRELGRSLSPPEQSPRRIQRAVDLAIRSHPRRSALHPDDVSRIRERITRRPQPFFTHRGPFPIRADSAGRLWVLGIDGDSGFADVFSSTEFLTRIPLSCPDFESRWALNDEWLVLVCSPLDSAFAGDNVFQLYRIED